MKWSLSPLPPSLLRSLTLPQIIPLLERGIILSEATAEDQLAKWKTMVSLCRNRVVQSLFMIVTSSSLSLRLPIPQNETQSFPWLLLIDPQPRSDSSTSLAFQHSWSETIFQMMSGEIVSSSFEGAIFGDLMKVCPLSPSLPPFLWASSLPDRLSRPIHRLPPNFYKRFSRMKIKVRLTDLSLLLGRLISPQRRNLIS
jgi:hypothetical protein